MKSPVKKQRGNAFHRGWPQAKESYLNSSSLEVHRSQESFRTRSNDKVVDIYIVIYSYIVIDIVISSAQLFFIPTV